MAANNPPLPSAGLQATTVGLRSDVLVRAAQPDLFRKNAFRITGLPVDAEPNQITRQVEKLRIAEKFGGATLGASRGAFALVPPPDSEQLRSALQRLNDPELRLIDEFFWFWPHELDNEADEALAAVAQGDDGHAATIWTTLESQQSVSSVSMHNLAVLAHLKVLDLEQSPQNGEMGAKEVAIREEMWRAAFRRWKVLLNNEAFWSRLTARIQRLDDPRLTTGTARRIRESLPLALLQINAQMAVQAAQLGRPSEAKRQLAIMQASGLEAKAVSKSLHTVIDPLRERIKTMCRAAEQELSVDISRGAVVVTRLLEQSLPLLAAIDCLLPEGDPLRDGAHDEVALQALSGQIGYGNKTEDWKTSVHLLEQVLPLAASASARTRLEDNLKILRENKKIGTCYFCEERPSAKSADIEVTVHGNIQRNYTGYNQVQTTWNHGTVAVPRCPECAAIHKKRHGTRSIGFLVMVLSLIAYMVSLELFADLTSYDLGAVTFILGLATFIIPGMLSGAIGHLRAKGARPEHSKFGFAGLQKRKAEGWKQGTAPPGTEIPSASASTSTYQPLFSRWSLLRQQVLAGKNVYIRLWAPLLLTLMLFPALVGLASGGVGATAFWQQMGLIGPRSAIARLEPHLDVSGLPALRAFNAMRHLLRAPEVDRSTAVNVLIKALRSGNPQVRAGASDELAIMGPGAGAAEKALEVAAATDSNADVARAASRALNRVNPDEAIRLGMEDLRSSSNGVRIRGAERLGGVGAAASLAVPLLLKAMTNRDVDVRNSVIRALGQVAPERVVPTLIGQLRNPSMQIRQNAAKQLGLVGVAAKSAVPALQEAARDSDNDVRFAATDALAKVAPNIPEMILQLTSTSLKTRQDAAQRLGTIGPDAKDAITALEAATSDPNPDVQKAAKEALQRVRR